MIPFLRCAVLFCVTASAFAQVRLRQVTTSLSDPTFITHADDGTGRIYIVSQRRGSVAFLDPNTVDLRAFLYPIESRISCCGERGLLSVAFPPGFKEKRRFYVYYTDLSGDIVVSRFGLDPPGFADDTSEEILLKISHREFATNNGGGLAFGPDGYLYIGTGDGGGSGDPRGNAQNFGSLLGKILRIDVEGAAKPYGIPIDNPFVNRLGARPEVWAYGLRNPKRLAFDSANGDLYIADSGENQYEEINIQPAGTGGQNYGWNLMEGTHCVQGICSVAGFTPPVVEYGRELGCSVIGGYIERGAYYYGDSCTGRIWKLQGGTNTIVTQTSLAISSLGQDESGRIYVADRTTGKVFWLVEGARIIPGGIVDAASYRPQLSPGALASIFGVGIAPVTDIVQAASVPIATELRGVRVLVNGVPAPVLAVANIEGLSKEQINFQVPWETTPGMARVEIEIAGRRSFSEEVQIVPAAPALFAVNGSAAALKANYSPLYACTYTMLGFSCPRVSAGETVLLYATGLGPVANSPATGAAALESPLSHDINRPAVTINGIPARVLFSGLAPGFVGLWQLNVEVPVGVDSGAGNPVVITAGERSSTPVRLTRSGG